MWPQPVNNLWKEILNRCNDSHCYRPNNYPEYTILQRKSHVGCSLCCMYFYSSASHHRTSFISCNCKAPTPNNYHNKTHRNIPLLDGKMIKKILFPADSANLATVRPKCYLWLAVNCPEWGYAARLLSSLHPLDCPLHGCPLITVIDTFIPPLPP